MAGKSTIGSVRKVHTRNCVQRQKCTCGRRGNHEQTCPKAKKCRCHGRYQARITAPSGEVVTAPSTFDTKLDADEWVKGERGRMVDVANYHSPKARAVAAIAARDEAARLADLARVPTLGTYAETYLKERRVKGRPLESSTLRQYRSYLRNHILPTFENTHLDDITPAMVNRWHDTLPDSQKTRRECYSLLRSILTTATSVHGPMVGRSNPAAIRGAGSGEHPHREELVTAAELEVIRANIRPEWDALVMLALWCGLRFGELTALRRSDIDLARKVIRVQRAQGKGEQGTYEKRPKSEAGYRQQRIPEHVLPVLRDHLRTYVTGRDGLVFPGPRGGVLHSSVFQGLATEHDKRGKITTKGRVGTWYEARRIAGRPDLHLHDLRATGATLLAQQGANVAEVQQWLGDSTPAAALRYIRAASGRMDTLTDKLSKLGETGGW